MLRSVLKVLGYEIFYGITVLGLLAIIVGSICAVLMMKQNLKETGKLLGPIFYEDEE